MKTSYILIFNETNNFLNEIVGGIYTGIDEKTIIDEIGENNIVCLIPLKVAGRCYNDRKNDLRNKAIDWSNTGGEYQNWSYGELSIIQTFFENNGRRYGLLGEFKENCIC